VFRVQGSKAEGRSAEISKGDGPRLKAKRLKKKINYR
jgi:hypothetical protein